jgi:hypothetical protein
LTRCSTPAPPAQERSAQLAFQADAIAATSDDSPDATAPTMLEMKRAHSRFVAPDALAQQVQRCAYQAWRSPA